jgi:two-component system, OmpR family, sensor kinase
LKGIVLCCEHDGRIDEIRYDDFGVGEFGGDGEGGAVLWTDLLDPDSREKGEKFFFQAGTRGAVFDWEMNMSVGGVLSSYHFAAIGGNDGVMIMAAETDDSLTSLLEEFTRIGNEQTNILRAVLKENAEFRRRAEQDDGLYDEISRLNNELVNLQRTLTKNNIELAELNELKNHFLGVAAHDLRNPLANMLLLLEYLLEDRDSFSERQYEYLSHINDTCEFLSDLVEELLDVSIIESGQVELNLDEADLVRLVGENLETNSLMADRKRIGLRFEPRLETAPVCIDRNKLEQVMNNIISNGVKFSHPDTEITVALRKSGSDFEIRVRDQGQGIRAEELPRLFHPFRKTGTTPTAGEKSTGLGLYIVKRIVEAHGGTIRVESEFGAGSTFTITLPASAGQETGENDDGVRFR